MAGQIAFEPYYDFQNPANERFQLKNELDALDSVDFKDIKYLSMSGAGWVD
jgi:hypothetical protein